MDDIEQKYNQAQADLIESFKTKLKKAAEETLGTLYQDVTNWASTDAHINYHNFLRDEFRDSFIKEITSEYSHYSWAHDIRMKLLKEHPEQIKNKIIEDLQDRIKSLEQHLEDMRRYR